MKYLYVRAASARDTFIRTLIYVLDYGLNLLGSACQGIGMETAMLDMT